LHGNENRFRATGAADPGDSHIRSPAQEADLTAQSALGLNDLANRLQEKISKFQV
jgi:hypothetical protein